MLVFHLHFLVLSNTPSEFKFIFKFRLIYGNYIIWDGRGTSLLKTWYLLQGCTHESNLPEDKLFPSEYGDTDLDRYL